MRISILHNPRPDCLPAGAPDDAFEEFDGPETIAAIAAALKALGHDTEPVDACADMLDTLRRGQFDFVFNIAEGTGRRCREAIPAAICEYLALPYSGSDPLTLGLTLDKWMARRVVSPDVPVARAVLVELNETNFDLSSLRF